MRQRARSKNIEKMRSSFRGENKNATQGPCNLAHLVPLKNLRKLEFYHDLSIHLTFPNLSIHLTYPNPA
jgi:hypothetical protein